MEEFMYTTLLCLIGLGVVVALLHIAYQRGVRAGIRSSMRALPLNTLAIEWDIHSIDAGLCTVAMPDPNAAKEFPDVLKTCVDAPGAISMGAYLVNEHPRSSLGLSKGEFWEIADDILEAHPIYKSYGFSETERHYITEQVYAHFYPDYDFTQHSYFRVNVKRRAEALQSAYALIRASSALVSGYNQDDQLGVSLEVRVRTSVKHKLKTVPEWTNHAHDITAFLMATVYPPASPDTFWTEFENNPVFTDIVAWLQYNHRELFSTNAPFVKGLWRRLS